jgi:hypothetical protein
MRERLTLIDRRLEFIQKDISTAQERLNDLKSVRETWESLRIDLLGVRGDVPAMNPED